MTYLDPHRLIIAPTSVSRANPALDSLSQEVLARHADRVETIQVVADMAKAIVRPVTNRLKRRPSIRSLNCLNDHMLADIGMTRDQVQAIERGQGGIDLTNMAAKLIAPAARWFARRQLCQQLNAMDDHMLDDIGISRDEIADIAYAGKRRPAPVSGSANLHFLGRKKPSRPISGQELKHLTAA